MLAWNALVDAMVPGGVVVNDGGEIERAGASRSLDIFKSDPGITTVVLADRRLAAGEP